MVIAFKTDRLSARPPKLEDTARITELMQEKDLPWMLGRAPWPYKLTDAEGWVTRLAESRAAGIEYGFVLYHADHGLIGSTGMMHIEDDIWEIGYWIGKPYWGQGYVTEAAKGVLGWAEGELGITRFVSGHIFDNFASRRVLIKLGFKLAGEIETYVKGRDCKVLASRYIRNAPVEVALKAASH